MNTSKTLAMILLLSSSVTLGCGKKDEGDKASGKTTEPAATDKTSTDPASGVEPFKGELTEDVLKKANRAISVYNPDTTPADFEPTFATAKIALGEPTHSEGNMHGWGFAKGDKCTYYSLENKDGKANTGGMMTVDKMAGGMYEKCMKAIGQALPEVKVDPPPADGPALPSAVNAGGKAKSADWVGKELTVKGVYISTSTSQVKGSDTKSVTMSIKDSKESKESGTACKLADGTEPPKLTQYDEITVKGTVDDFGWLENCSIVTK